MVITRLTGGLANQMFQYAFGRRTASLNQTQLKLDTSWYRAIDASDTPRSYHLNILNVTEAFATPKEVRWREKQRWNRLLNKFKPYWRRTLLKDYHTYDPNTLKSSGDVYLIGDWQGEMYFADIAELIRKEFTIKAPLSVAYQSWLQRIQGSKSISLHVRRGDYVKNLKYRAFYTECTPDYYETAFSIIARKVRTPTVLIFSDDIPWVKENIKLPCPIEFVTDTGTKDYEDIFLQAACRHHIIANSSFSWWGAWLNPRSDKIVVSPKQWFNTQAMGRLLPENWVKI